MRIKVAAAAPEILPGRPGQNFSNVLAAISRARADGAAMLVLPAGLPEDMNQGAIQRQAGKMTVYPLMRASLGREELTGAHEKMDVLCCSADSAATVSSYIENSELAALASLNNKAVVVMACPRGGTGGALYTGQCVIAQNGYVLASSESGYALASVTVPRRDVKEPAEATVTDQPTTPWTPEPEMLPRVLGLQADGLARRMVAAGETHLSLSVGRDASSLLALAACCKAVDLLKLSRRNIQADVTGRRGERIAARLGVTVGPAAAGLAVDTADLTARALEGAAPEHYAVNATVPRSVGRLVMRYYANTCGDRELSGPVRSIVKDDETPWELYDFLLHFTLVYGLPKWSAARLLDDTFRVRYASDTIHDVLDRFFDGSRVPAPCDGPAVFELKKK